MEPIKDIIKIGEYRNETPRQRFIDGSCTADQFATTFIQFASNRVNFGARKFVVDDSNQKMINQLFFYLVGSQQFAGDLYKGLLLIGPVGNGKTLLMETFCHLVEVYAGKIITQINSRDVARLIAENHVGHFERRPLFIDDIGKEQVTVNNYGTKSHPVEDLIADRYKSGGLTLATSNVKLEGMVYPDHTIDRMREMFNIFEMVGESWRQ